MKKVLLICLVLIVSGLMGGCTEEGIRHLENEIVRVSAHIGLVADVVDDVETTNDSMLDAVNKLTVANTASAPFNPYAGIIATALGGLSLYLNGQRKNERSSRKYAENKLNQKNNV